MELSAEDRAIIGHVVVDPDAWADHASKAVGDWAVKAKIDKYRADYLAQKTLLGDHYQTREDKEIFALVTQRGKTEDQARSILGLPSK